MKQWQAQNLLSPLRSFFWAIPALIWQILLLYIPLVFVLLHSFVDKDLQFTLAHYAELFDANHFIIIARSLGLATVTALICLLVAYPVAYFLSFHVSRLKNVFLFS